MRLFIFEDEFLDDLFPVAAAKPAYAIQVASYRLVDWIRSWGYDARGLVRPYLNSLQVEDYADLSSFDSANKSGPLALINARLVPAKNSMERLRKLIHDGKPGVVKSADGIAAAILPADAPQPTADLTGSQWAEYLQYAGVPGLPALTCALPLLRRPHDLVFWNLEEFGDNLQHRIEQGNYKEIADGVFASGEIRIGDHWVTDTSSGPIVLEENVSIGAHGYMAGPVYIGKGSRILEHASIKDAVSVGHTVKIGGEVEASIIEPFTNKQHHGFLGHSYLGSWINLGAGTCNSDLKNTYGDIKMEYRGKRVSTGMQFMGCVMGDYSKTAINTSIFTGKVVGVCSMLYGFVTTNVPSFTNYARSFGQVTELPPEVMVATQQRMFARRKVEQRACDAEIISELYEKSRHERQLAGEPLSL